jgi:hypothetical protein
VRYTATSFLLPHFRGICQGVGRDFPLNHPYYTAFLGHFSRGWGEGVRKIAPAAWFGAHSQGHGNRAPTCTGTVPALPQANVSQASTGNPTPPMPLQPIRVLAQARSLNPCPINQHQVEGHRDSPVCPEAGQERFDAQGDPAQNHRRDKGANQLGDGLAKMHDAER